MGSYVLRGITTALLITVLTVFAGILWRTMGFDGLSVSHLMDIGLLASCIVAGYRTAKESKVWFMGGAAGAGYVVVGTLLLALFLPIRGLGFIQVLAEGIFVGLVAGAFGANKGTVSNTFTPSYAGYGKDNRFSSSVNWDAEEKFTPSKSNWDWESSENQFQEVREIKPDSVEDAVVEWPWDRKNENNLFTRESNQVQNDLVVWDKGKEKAIPWWEQ